MGRLSTSVFSPWSSDPAHGRFAALHSGTTIPYRASPRVLSELHSMVLDSILPRPRARVPCSEKKNLCRQRPRSCRGKKIPIAAVRLRLRRVRRLRPPRSLHCFRASSSPFALRGTVLPCFARCARRSRCFALFYPRTKPKQIRRAACERRASLP
jgi:hypothetical protein